MRRARLGVWYERFLLVAAVVSIATGVYVGVSTYTAGRIAKRSCERSKKFGPYLATAYATDFDRRPGHVFRLMPLDAARAYRDSIPKHC